MPFPFPFKRPSTAFTTNSAADEAGQLLRRNSSSPQHTPSPVEELESAGSDPSRRKSESQPELSSTRSLLHAYDGAGDYGTLSSGTVRKRANSGRRKHRADLGEGTPLADQIHNHQSKSNVHNESIPKPGALPRPVGGNEKLGTFSGVFVPTCLNVLSILMFLRFGFILGQAGVLGMMGMLVASYIIDFITTLSLSAIASNGTVRGGGAFYLISRTLGAEFGSAIGVVFYLGVVTNAGMNAVGLIDCLKQNFGTVSGNWAHVLPEGHWWEYLWATLVLIVCTGICLAGSSIFARASNGLLIVLLIALFSIPFSALIMSPWEDRAMGIRYTGLSWDTFKGNFMPHLTRGAAGSQLKGKETFQNLFGILFPATGGIFAGASMSGDLKHPSKAIPKGTLYGLGLTFIAYTLVILAMAATVTRASFLRNINIIQDTNMSGTLILGGEFASTVFSTLMGLIGSAKLLQAFARDKLLPGVAIFGQGTKKGDEPTYAIFFTYALVQFTMLADINQIASFVTMSYLMTFLVMNLATFLLKIGSAPNFRPSFSFFTWQSALTGTILSGAAMFFVDGRYATACVVLLLAIFMLTHYTAAPKAWGDVSQGLIYHQVRKYLLRLRPEHVKFWRPQILLLVNDPRRQYKLIQFCNSMKKGALYILGHVIVEPDFGSAVPEARRQQAAWTKFIEVTRVKAFVSITISPAIEWGVRNIVLGAGLGGMRPNITVLGFYNMDDLRSSQALTAVPRTTSSQPSNAAIQEHASQDGTLPKRGQDLPQEVPLPTDSCETEKMVGAMNYVMVLEDLLLRLQVNVAVAKGFKDLKLPQSKNNSKLYIDLWPIQMSAEIASEGEGKANMLTTNFDTYTLILQLGCILNTVPAWKKAYKLRIAVFVEYESDVEEERGRVQTLLTNLRIKAEILVFWLASGDLHTYEVIVNGQSPGLDAEKEVGECLEGHEWWEEIQKIRGKRDDEASPDADIGDSDVKGIFAAGSKWQESLLQAGSKRERIEQFLGLKKLLRKSKKRHTMSGLSRLGVNLGMRTQNLHPQYIKEHLRHDSRSDDSSSSDSDSDALESDDEDDESERESAASEGDILDFQSESEPDIRSPTKIMRRRSHGDSMRGPPVSKKSTGEREPIAPDFKRSLGPMTPGSTSNNESRPKSSDSRHSVSNLTNSINSRQATATQSSQVEFPPSAVITPERLEERFSALRQSPSKRGDRPKSTSSQQSHPERPPLSRHTSMPKFSSKPVPMTKVATEDGPGPSIMFTETPSPPNRRNHLPSAYQSRDGASNDYRFPEHISEVSEDSSSPGNETGGDRDGDGTYSPGPTSSQAAQGSTYSTQALPLSFNDLPCRAQHLILNELIRQNSEQTAVMFTTLPSPLDGTSKSEEGSVAYLSDLEVLTKDVPPVLLICGNNMTVTTSL